MRNVAWPAALLASLALSGHSANGAPEVTHFYPSGGQRGQTVAITVGGALPQWPVSFWTSDDHVKVTALEEKGKASVEIAPDAVSGLLWIRVCDEQGAAQPKPWVVGLGPEVNEEEPNDQPKEAQLAACADAPQQTLVINGRLQQQGDADVFAVDVQKGQTLVADLDAHATIASPFDGVLQILGPDGFVAAHDDDCHGLDPQLAVPVEQAGRRFVRVFGFPATPTEQIRLGGDPAYVYRLTISVGPVVHYALPMASRRDHDNRFTIHGWNLTEDLRSVSVRPTSRQNAMPIGEQLFGRTLSMPLLDCPVIVETEPNNASEPIPLELPASVTGRIGERGDRDGFQFEGVQGETVEIDLESRDLGYPLDGVLELFDAKDKRLARVDDEGARRDPRLVHQVKQDGPLRLVVSDLYGHGGPDAVYRLSIVRAHPSFRLTTESHQAVVKVGDKAEIAVNIERKLGLDQAIEFEIDGLPDGVVASMPVSKPGEESAAKVVVSLTAADDAAPTSAALVITGKSQSAGSQPVRFPAPGHPTGLSQVWLTVTK